MAGKQWKLIMVYINFGSSLVQVRAEEVFFIICNSFFSSMFPAFFVTGFA
jgi:hypothetical protein